jgi:hypothetical protein
VKHQIHGQALLHVVEKIDKSDQVVSIDFCLDSTYITDEFRTLAFIDVLDQLLPLIAGGIRGHEHRSLAERTLLQWRLRLHTADLLLSVF